MKRTLLIRNANSGSAGALDEGQLSEGLRKAGFDPVRSVELPDADLPKRADVERDNIEVIAIVSGDGTISILPSGETNVVALDRIKLVKPEPGDLMKGADGLLRSKAGAGFAADASVQLVPGALEGSNVNTAHALVSMIELARRYETQVKLMATADDAARSTDRLMSLS